MCQNARLTLRLLLVFLSHHSAINVVVEAIFVVVANGDERVAKYYALARYVGYFVEVDDV